MSTSLPWTVLFVATPKTVDENFALCYDTRLTAAYAEAQRRVAGALSFMGGSRDIALALLARSVRAEPSVDEESVEGAGTRSGAAVGGEASSSPSSHPETSGTAKYGARSRRTRAKGGDRGKAKTPPTPKETQSTPSTSSTSTPASSSKKRTNQSNKSSSPKPGNGTRRDRGSGGGGSKGGGGYGKVDPKRPPNRYPEFWPRSDVEQGLHDGTLLLGKLRVSAHHKHEAFVTVDGVPHDIKFDGFDSRNRTVDGDTVVFAIDPVEFWPALNENKWDTPARADGRCAGGRAKQRQRKREAKAKAEAKAKGQVSSDHEEEDTEDTGVADIAQGMDSLTTHAIDDDDDDDDANTDSSDDAYEISRGDLSLPSSPATKLLADAARSGGVNATPLRPTGIIVAVHVQSPRRDVVVGYLDYHDCEMDGFNSASQETPPLRFFPTDPKLPFMRVDTADAPREVEAACTSPKDMATLRKHLVLARVYSWPCADSHPTCVVSEVLGDAQDLETATAALIAEHAVLGADDFSDEALACLPTVPTVSDPVTGKPIKKWSIPPDERANRRDFTETRVVSIDPPTARDLDDALHCEFQKDGTLKVGVHIADVSFFVEPGTALDDEARKRATSTYLVDRVMPMLPRLLCEDLCSLNPGVERLTFSAEWVMTTEGKVLSEWFGRGVIRSCAKLDYGTAQLIIDARDNGGTGVDALLQAVEMGNDSGPVKIDASDDGHSMWDPEAVAKAVHGLNCAARAMRQRRFAGGALRLDQTKLLFQLDESTGSPTSTFPYKTRESNHLVEEFMLLANAAAARLVSRAFPANAMLRCHPPPNERKLGDLEQFAKEQGLDVDASSSAGLHRSLVNLKHSNPDGYEIVQLLATLPMQLARYFSTGEQDLETWGHYALAAPRYTHFTSPIRRYPDVLVHRQLNAALDAGFAPAGFRGGILGERNLGETEKVSKSQKQLASQCADSHGLPCSETLKLYASHCNERKLSAKAVQDGSSHAYLCAYLRAEPKVVSAIVRASGKKYLRVFIPDFGCEARVELDGLRHLATANAGNGEGVTLVFEPTASPEDLKTAQDPGVPKKERRKAMRGVRGLRGAFLNVGEAEHSALDEVLKKVSSKETSSATPVTSGDVFSCGAPPRTLPSTIRPVQRVCLLLGAKFPERAKPEMTATLLLRNPLNGE